MYAADQSNKAAVEAAEREQDQIEDAAADATNVRIREARAARATARAAAAEAGVAGNSVSALLKDAPMQAGMDIGKIEHNRANGIASSAASAKASQRINNARAAGQVVQSAYSGYTNYQDSLKIQGGG
uniref:Uncharacterized protein n=1 Tax=Coralloluteibacterium stylophorae TaxID=1776034 RepID=A0A8J8AWX1_9GAMM